MRYRTVSQATAAHIAPFPQRADVNWETTNVRVWNARESIPEQYDLVYEVSWVEELGIWRRFLTSRRKVN
jgi:hypothetical protein